MRKQFVEMKIFIPQEVYEKIIDYLINFQNSGYFEDEDNLTCYFKWEDWNDDILSKVEDFIKTNKADLGIKHFEVKVNIIEEKNWNQIWEESIEPIVVSDRIIIKPTWKDIEFKKDQIVIEIDPKMAFGTGHHETTRLCVQALEKYISPGNNILDMGTGTGIIAIAGILLGASFAVGIDNDEWATDNALENIALNNVKDKIKINLGDESNIPNEKFDIITSNIDFKTNSKLISLYPDYLQENGIIILSGLLVSDLPEMKDLIHKNNLNVMEEFSENEWGCLIVKQKSRNL